MALRPWLVANREILPTITSPAQAPRRRPPAHIFFGSSHGESLARDFKHIIMRQDTQMVEVPPPAVSRGLKQRWAHCIKQLYGAEPLLSPQCGEPMRIIAFID